MSKDSGHKPRRFSGEAIRETLGFIGVVASLIFVGWEIRQNTAVARGQARQGLAELNQEWLILQATDSSFHDIFHRFWRPAADSGSIEADRATWAMRLNIRRLENVYFQYREGLVEESALNSYGLQASPAFQTDAFRVFWIEKNERAGYDPQFVQFFESRFGLNFP